jgi:methylase of polypeptide subunit release factors
MKTNLTMQLSIQNLLETSSIWTTNHRKRGLPLSVAVVATAQMMGASGNEEAKQTLDSWLQGSSGAELLATVNQQIDSSLFDEVQGILNEPDLELRRVVLHLAEKSASNPIDSFAELYLACYTPEEAKARGAIFTPSWLAKRIVGDTLGHWRRIHRQGQMPRLVADVSCGIGAFLMPSRDYFGTGVKIVGVDCDPLCIAFASLLNRALKHKWELSCHDPLLEVASRYTLFNEPSPFSSDGFDILVGNPPYVRGKALEASYRHKLRLAYPEITKGNFDLVVLFLEHALRTLCPGGIASYIVSHKFMVSSYGKAICKRLTAHARIISILDFQDLQIFEGHTTYTSVITFGKLPPAKYFSVTRFPNGNHIGRELSKGRTSSLSSERLQDHPWNFVVGLEHDALRKLHKPSNPLITQVFTEIRQGLRTGANSIYILNHSNATQLEPQLLVPLVSGEDIRRCHIRSGSNLLLYPYKSDQYGTVTPYTEEELSESFPKAWNYLQSYRQQLSERGLEANQPWYAYSRSQNLGVSSKPKILVREMMPRAEFAADCKGHFAFCSGYALLALNMNSNDLRLWAAILSTPTMEFALRHSGTELHSGWFRLLKHHLQTVRLPLLSSRAYKQALNLVAKLYIDPVAKSVWSELDDIVARSFNLKTSERNAIKQFLDDCHSRSIPSNNEQAPSLISTHNPQEGKELGAYEPVRLTKYESLHRDRPDLGSGVSFKPNKWLPIHRWYSFHQGFSEPLVKALLEELQVNSDMAVLDPFCGCGTTLVTCLKEGIQSTGIEVSPFMAWVSRTKTRDWNPEELRLLISMIESAKPGPREPGDLLFAGFLNKAFSPEILAKLVGLVRWIDESPAASDYKDFLRLGIVSIMEEVSQIRKHGSHYRFMVRSESAGLQKLNTQIVEASYDVLGKYIGRLRDMATDVEIAGIPRSSVSCEVVCGDARSTGLPDACVDTIITSPPYLNRNNYIAQQKAELSLLGILTSYGAYRELVKRTFRSHVESDLGREPVTKFPEVRTILEAITLSDNNNPKIPHMIAGYFEDLDSTLAELWRLMRPGSEAAFVVGNSRWGGIVVPVDHLLLMLAEKHNFQPLKVLVTREKGNSPQQMRRYGRIPTRESIVVFRKPK